MAKTESHERAPMALYRKYRPGNFDDFRDQDQIVRVLEAAVAQKKIAHAYLFAGGRGTGKTSMARALARAVGTAERDIYEMDAASNRGIDEVRELRDSTASLPFESTYKFYIIDEAHALTPQAWQALLKTIEEPPSHVVFILATTELDRVPDTIISRCQTFRFKKPSHETLKKLVLDVAKKEGSTLSPGGAELIALMGDGSFRDTLGILQKVLTVSTDKTLSEAEVSLVVGAPQALVINQFLEAVAEKNMAKAIEIFHKALQGGVEPKVFITLLLAKVRGILLLRFAPELKKNIEAQWGEQETTALLALAGTQGAAINAQFLSECITALLETARAPIPAVPLELALYRIFAK